MNSLSTYFYLLMLLSASGLCISLIFYIGKAMKSIKIIEGEILKVSENLNKILEKSAEVTGKVDGITVEVKQQLEVTKNLIVKVDNRVDEIFALEAELRGHFAIPLKGAFKMVSAVYTGFSTFWSNYRRH